LILDGAAALLLLLPLHHFWIHRSGTGPTTAAAFSERAYENNPPAARGAKPSPCCWRRFKYGDLTLGLIMAAAMCINMLSSAVAGVLIPLLFDRIGVGPALVSGVALTTVTDVAGFFAVLGFAAMLI